MATEAETFERFGRAAFKAQMFETSMVTLLITTRTLVGKPFKNRDDAQAYIDRLDKDNLGWLLGKLGQLTDLDHEVATMLETAVNARNTLTHHFFARYASALHTAEGRDQVCADIDQCLAAIYNADDQVINRIEMLREQMKELGMIKNTSDHQV